MKSVRNLLQQWKKESGATRIIQYKYSSSTGTLYIYTSQPGILIGRYGNLVDKYKKIFKENIMSFEKFEFIETDYFWV